MTACPGSLVVHRDGTSAGCTNGNASTAFAVAIYAMRVTRPGGTERDSGRVGRSVRERLDEAAAA